MVVPADLNEFTQRSAEVLASQVVKRFGNTGVQRGSDAVVSERRCEDSSAVMGFVGANTDAGVPTVGHQLIATGVSMTDGFLAANAAVFARLFRETGERHWLDLARIVVHGTTAMLALDGRVFDLRGPGWQQEHWSFSPRRGFGLNRRWLPWVPVAHIRGAHRVEDLGADIAQLVLSWSGTP